MSKVADNIQSLLELWIGFLWKTYRLHFCQMPKAFVTQLLQTLILKEVEVEDLTMLYKFSCFISVCTVTEFLY